MNIKHSFWKEKFFKNGCCWRLCSFAWFDRLFPSHSRCAHHTHTDRAADTSAHSGSFSTHTHSLLNTFHRSSYYFALPSIYLLMMSYETRPMFIMKTRLCMLQCEDRTNDRERWIDSCLRTIIVYCLCTEHGIPFTVILYKTVYIPFVIDRNKASSARIEWKRQ